MKKNIYVLILLIIAVGAFLYFNKTKNEVDPSDLVNASDYIENTISSELNEEEINGLLIMREEEKLAYDVYVTLYQKWNLNIFKNISESELTHTDAVKYLLDKYKIEDPVKDFSVGVFTNPMFTDLYKNLVTKGEQSLLDALLVGATVEELDIRDLRDLSLKTNAEDIKIIYSNLEKGSRKHLRAFFKQIQRNGGDYKAQYLSQEELDLILSSPQEKGPQS